MDKKQKLDIIQKFLAFINKDPNEENYQLSAFSYACKIYNKHLTKSAEEFSKDWMVGAGCKNYQDFKNLINQVKGMLNQLKVPSDINRSIKRPNPPREVMDIINYEAKEIPHPIQKVYGNYSILERKASPEMFKAYLIYPLILMVEGKSNERPWLRSCKKCGIFFLDHTKNHSNIFCQAKCKVSYHRKPVTANR